MTTTFNEHDHARRRDGQFTAMVKAEPGPGVSLGLPAGPTLGPSVVRGMAREVADLNNDELDVVVPRLSSSLSQSGDYSDQNVSEEIDRIGYDEWGFRPSDRQTYRTWMASLDEGVRESVGRFVSDTGGHFAGQDLGVDDEQLEYLRRKLTGEPAAPGMSEVTVQAMLNDHREHQGRCATCKDPEYPEQGAAYPCAPLKSFRIARAAAGGKPAGTPNDPVLEGDPRIDAGLAPDTVEIDGTKYHRLRDGVEPGEPSHLRFQADRDLSDDEMLHLSQAAGYPLFNGEGFTWPERDSSRSFTVFNDTTKGRQYRQLHTYPDSLAEVIEDGSPVRTTNRAGEGTKGTRKVQPMDNPPQVEIYYDDVYGPALSQ